MFDRRLKFDETLKLIERNVLNVNNTHICIDKLSKNSTDEWLINEIKVDNEKQEIFFDVIKCDTAITNNREPIWIPYKWIKEISNMPIECVLEAYEMGETNRLIEIYIDTDIEKDILGKQYADLEDFELYDGLKIILYKDKNEKYCNKVLTIKGVGDKISVAFNRGRPRKRKN